MKAKFHIVSDTIQDFIKQMLEGTKVGFGKNREKLSWDLYPQRGQIKDHVELKPNPMLCYCELIGGVAMLLTSTPYSNSEKPNTFLFEISLSEGRQKQSNLKFPEDLSEGDWVILCTQVFMFDIETKTIQLQSFLHEHEILSADPGGELEMITSFFEEMEDLAANLKSCPELSAST